MVRIEVTDTGKGIRSKDMVQCKLFCECTRSSHWQGCLNAVVQLHSTKRSSADNRVARAPALVSLLFDRL